MVVRSVDLCLAFHTQSACTRLHREQEISMDSRANGTR